MMRCDICGHDSQYDRSLWFKPYGQVWVYVCEYHRDDEDAIVLAGRRKCKLRRAAQELADVERGDMSMEGNDDEEGEDD